MRNALQRLFPHLTHPIFAAPMAGTSGWELAVAVSKAGGFGLLGTGYDTNPEWLHDQLKHARHALPAGANGRLPIGVGFINWSLNLQEQRQEQRLLELVLAYRPAAVWFSFGETSELVRRVRAWDTADNNVGGGCKVIAQVSSVREALQAVSEWGVDVVVVQGSEAGGHGARRNASLHCLLPETVDALQDYKIPILAAGGIVDGRGVAAALLLGADGVVMGTRFSACHEANSSDGAKRALIDAKDGGQATVRTSVFDELRGLDWPEDYDGLALKNDTTDHASSATDTLISPQAYTEAARRGDTTVAGVFAGQGVGMVRELLSAEQIISRVTADAKSHLERAPRLLDNL